MSIRVEVVCVDADGGEERREVLDRAAGAGLQTRTKVLNEELDDVFRRWYSKFRLQPPTQEPARKAA